MAFKTSVNLGLPAIADPPDPTFFGEITRIFNAIRNLAMALDQYTGNLGADAVYYSSTKPSSSVLVQNMQRLYVQCGVAITAGQAVHLYNTAGVLTAELASAATTAKPMHGFCTVGAAINGYAEVMLGGLCTLIGGLTPGATYYLANTAGAVALTAGTTTQRIGIALGVASLFVQPTLV